MIKKNLREEQAVTLTALVITIIVLIILAAVSVIGVFGENGIFKSAITAKVDTETAAYTEELKAIEVQTRTQEIKSSSEFIYLNAFETNVRNNFMFKEAREIEQKNENTILRIVTKEGYIFYVSDDEIQGVIPGGIIGEVEEPVDLIEGENVRFSYDDSTWTKGPKDVTITLQNIENPQQLQYSTDGKNWTNCDSGVVVKMTTIGNVYARLYNGAIGGGVAKVAIEKIDTLKPNAFVPEIYTTADSITVKANTTDANATSKSGQSGIATYQYSKDGGTSWVTGTTEYVFVGLSVNETYTIVVRVTDNAGNVYETTPIPKDLVPLPDLSDGSDGKPSNLTISCNPSTYTNKNVTVTISTTENLSAYGFKLEYSLDGTNYNEYTKPFEVEKNGKVWIAVSNGNGKRGTAFEKTIDWIDKLNPDKVEVKVTDKKSNSLTVLVDAKDAEATDEYASSGIATYHYSIDGGLTYQNGGSSSSYTFNNLVANTKYEIKVKVEDYAGNPAETDIISGKDTTTDKIPDLIDPETGKPNPASIIFTSVPDAEYVKEAIVSAVVKIDITGYNLEYQKNSEGWKPYTAGTGVSFTQNGTFSIRLNDGKNISEPATFEVDNVDGLDPILSNITLESRERTSLKISVTAEDQTGEDYVTSGINKYAYRVNDEEWKESINTTITLTGLKEDTTYKIEVKAVDKAGNESTSKTITAKTKVTPILEPEDPNNPGSGTISFKYNPSKETWAQEKTVTLVIKEEIKNDYVVKYAIDAETEIVYTEPFKVNKNNSIITVKLYDGEETTALSTINDTVKNIDTVKPGEFKLSPTGGSKAEKTSITIKGNAIDGAVTEISGKSGISKYYFSVDNINWLPTAGIDAGLDEEEVTYTITGLNENTQYSIYVKVIDKAGNETSSKVTEVKTLSVPTLIPDPSDDPNVQPNMTFVFDPPSYEGFTKGPVNIKVNLNLEDSDEYILKYSRTAAEGSWETFPKETGVNYSNNGPIYVRLEDNGGTTGGMATGTVSHIDKDDPNPNFTFTIPYLGTDTIRVQAVTEDTPDEITGQSSGIARYEFGWALEANESQADGELLWNWPSTATVDANKSMGSYTIKDLEAGKTYRIKAKAYDKVGNFIESTNHISRATKSTEEGPGGNHGDLVNPAAGELTYVYYEEGSNIPLDLTEENWTNKNIRVKINAKSSFNPNKYKIRYSYDFGDTWVSESYIIGGEGFVVTDNKIITAQLYSDEDVSDFYYGEIWWIDRDSPIDFTARATEKIAGLTVSGHSQGDAKSGIKEYYVTYYPSTADYASSSNTDSRKWINGQRITDFTPGQDVSYTFEGLGVGSYTVLMKAVDKAGNETISTPDTASALKVPALETTDITYSYSNMENGVQKWTNEDVTLTIELTNTSAKNLGCEIAYKTDIMTDYEKYTEPLTLTEYTNIYVALMYNGVLGEKIQIESPKIDKVKPKEYTLTTEDVTATSSSVKVDLEKSNIEDRLFVDDEKNNQYNTNSGIDQTSYYYTCEYYTSSTGEVKLESGKTNSKYTFDGIPANTQCYITVRYYDNAGNFQEAMAEKTTSSIVQTTSGMIKFTQTPAPEDASGSKVYTNGRVLVTIALADGYVNEYKDYDIYYYTSADTNKSFVNKYTESTKIYVENNNTTVYARILDSNGKGTGSASTEVKHIDKEKPVITSENLSIEMKPGEEKSLLINITESGVSGLKGYAISDDPNLDLETLGLSGATWETCSAGNTLVKIPTIHDGGVHELYVWVADNAGNISSRKTINVTILEYLVDFVDYGDYVDFGVNYTSVVGSGTGWRVLEKNGSGSDGYITLISAGAPLTFCHPNVDVNQTMSNLGDLYKTLEKQASGQTDGFISSGFSGESFKMVEIFSIVNGFDLNKGIHSFTTTEFCAIYDQLMGTTGSTMQKGIVNRPLNAAGLKGMLCFYGTYWLAGEYAEANCMYYANTNYTNGRGGTYGIRPVIYLNSGTKISNTNKGDGSSLDKAWQYK